MEAEVFSRMARLESRHWWFCARRRILKTMLDHFRPRGEVLEILEAGCGTGGNLPMLSEYGNLYAFELDPLALEIARSRGFVVEQGFLPDQIPFSDKQFDLILLLDVLEHVEADESSLEALRALLKPGGRLILTVPALPLLWSAHDDHHHHFRRYSRKTLRKEAHAAGLQVRLLSYFNCFLFPAVALIRVGKKVSHSTRSDERLVIPTFMNHVLTFIFSSERFLLPWIRFPFGVSLIAIFERAPDK